MTALYTVFLNTTTSYNILVTLVY